MVKYRYIGLLLPVLGIFLFLLFYWMATIMYPGGSFEHPLRPGFSWKENFWCNLMDRYAINGNINHARPWALTGMSGLAISMMCFWYYVPFALRLSTLHCRIIITSGILCILLSFVLLSRYHDEAVNTAGFTGMVALTGILVGLHGKGHTTLYILGVSAVLMCIGNNCIYYTGLGLSYLAVIQKITFITFLFWIVLVCLQLYIAPLQHLPVKNQK